MDGDGIPLRDAWLTLYPRLVHDNLLIPCAHLVDWFCLALVAHPFANADRTPVLNATTQRQRLAPAQSWRFAHQAKTISNTTPLGKWKELIDYLLMTCRVPREDQLPPFWHVLTRNPKQQDMAILRAQLLA